MDDTVALCFRWESDVATNVTAIEVPKLRFAEPRRNLPGPKGVATAEDRFTISFLRAYARQLNGIHHRSNRNQIAFAREIPVNGHGIADLHVVAWHPLPDECFPSAEAFLRVARPHTRAFECKLSDWRRAMSQAARYRYFAHQAIVVLPTDVCTLARRYLTTFRKIQVGLWSFSPVTGKIVPHYTPRARMPRSLFYCIQAIDRVSRASRQALPISRRG